MSGTGIRIVHQMPGRARLRLHAARGQPAFLQGIQESLARCPHVRRVEINAVTGSILIWHDGELNEVLKFAGDRNLFEVRAEEPAIDPLPIPAIADSFRKLDEQLRSRSNDRWGLGTMSFYGLLGATAFQIVQGRILPPAGTLIFQAMTIFLRTLKQDRKRGS